MNECLQGMLAAGWVRTIEIPGTAKPTWQWTETGMTMLKPTVRLTNGRLLMAPQEKSELASLDIYQLLMHLEDLGWTHGMWNGCKAECPPIQLGESTCDKKCWSMVGASTVMKDYLLTLCFYDSELGKKRLNDASIKAIEHLRGHTYYHKLLCILEPGRYKSVTAGVVDVSLLDVDGFGDAHEALDDDHLDRGHDVDEQLNGSGSEDGLSANQAARIRAFKLEKSFRWCGVSFMHITKAKDGGYQCDCPRKSHR
eukprot:1618972-Pyramimonas_sp.AAC.1